MKNIYKNDNFILKLIKSWKFHILIVPFFVVSQNREKINKTHATWVDVSHPHEERIKEFFLFLFQHFSNTISHERIKKMK